MLRAAAIFIVLLSSAVALVAAVPIAPVQHRIGPNPYADYPVSAVTNGDSTLFLWTNQFPGAVPLQVRGALQRGESRTPPFQIGGNDCSASSNGREYLAVCTTPISRLTSIAGIFAVTIGHDGEISPVTWLESRFGQPYSVSDVISAGDQWAVLYSDGIALFDGALAEPPRVLREPASNLAAANGELWSFVLWSDGSLQATEIRMDGSTGRRFNAEGTIAAVATVDDRILLALRDRDGTLRIVRFDSNSGFSPTRASLGAVQGIIGMTADHRDAMLVTSTTERTSVYTFDSAGTLIGSRTIFEGSLSQVRLGNAADGPIVMFESAHEASVRRETKSDVYAFHLSQLENRPFTLADAALVSSVDFGQPVALSLLSNGTNLIALWDVTTDDDDDRVSISTSLRASGEPLGAPVQLSRAVYPEDTAFDGERFFLVSSESSVLAGDGKDLGQPFSLHWGYPVRVAASKEGAFAIWESYSSPQTIQGTPLRIDGSPEVPGGFNILPSLFRNQTAPAIAAIENGYLIVWNDQIEERSVVISTEGTAVSSTTISNTQAEATDAFIAAQTNNALAAIAYWNSPSSLLACGRDGGGFEEVKPPWGRNWRPVAVFALPEGRFEVVYTIGERTFASQVKMQNGLVTSFDPPRLLAPVPLTKTAIALLNDTLYAIWSDGTNIVLGTAEANAGRRRAVQ